MRNSLARKLPSLYLDTESVGLHGLPVLLQYAIDDGPIEIYDIWLHSVAETLELVANLMKNCFIGFNISFDMFMLCKLFTIWSLLPGDWIPVEHIEEIAAKEAEGRDGLCLKPASCLDLMLHSRTGPLQMLMNREEIRIRKIPTILAAPLANELEKRVALDGILFAKRKDKEAPRWKVLDKRNADNELIPDFKDISLVFNAAGGLKFIAEYVLGIKPDYYYDDVEPSTRPAELGYVPFATGIASAPDWSVYDKKGKLIGQAWPALVADHIKHWATNKHARQYASDDVKYTRLLDKHFGCPAPDDDNSTLACMVAAVRWHGFVVDLEKSLALLEAAKAKIAASPVNLNKPLEIRRYIRECMLEEEALLIDESTDRGHLEKIRDSLVVTEPELCIKCSGKGCNRCRGKGTLEPGLMLAAERASEMIKLKVASKEVDLHEKLQKAGRFHASFNVIGTLSSRMSGGDGLNAQGIKHTADVRRIFPLAWDGMVLCGGDFDSFEITLADAVFKDPALREDLLKGTKIHAVMGTMLYPGKTYEDILASKDTDFDMYTRGKQAIFALLYGGDFNTINKKLSVPLETAERAFDQFLARYPVVKQCRERVFKQFAAMTQPGGIGTAITWVEPADYAETFLGFRRYFTLENKICKELYTLGLKPPKAWHQVKVKVVRRDREQTAAGAVASALYGTSFQLQAANGRAANNHMIQSPGAEITKRVQRRIWDLQPVGINDWCVAPFNVHDEVLSVTRPDYVGRVTETVRTAVESFRPQVPLIGMSWSESMANWAEKGKGTVHIAPPADLVDSDFMGDLDDLDS